LFVKQKHKLTNVIFFLSFVMFLASFSVLSIQIFTRYMFGYSFPWGEEFARYALIYISYIGCGLLLMEGLDHPKIEVINQFLRKKTPNLIKYLNKFFSLLEMTFLLILIWKGVELCVFNLMDRTPALRVSMAIPYSSIPVGSFLMFIGLVIKFRQGGNEKHI